MHYLAHHAGEQALAPLLLLAGGWPWCGHRPGAARRRQGMAGQEPGNGAG